MPVTWASEDVGPSTWDSDAASDTDTSSPSGDEPSVWSSGTESGDEEAAVNKRSTFLATEARRRREVRRLSCQPEDCKYDLESEPAHMQAPLRQALLRRNIRFGARFLIIAVLFTEIHFWLGVIAKRYNCELAPLTTHLATCWRMLPDVLAQVAFVMCIHWPKLWLYMAGTLMALSVHVYFVAVESTHQWNFHFSCHNFNFAQSEESKNYDLLQANTFMMLMLPLIVPTSSLMQLVAGLWTSVAYIKAMIAFGWASPEAHLRGVFYIGTSFVIIITKRRMERQQIAQLVLAATEQRLSENLIRILGYMLPPHVLCEMLRFPDRQFASHIERASILFVEFEDFDNIARVLTPDQLVNFLNVHFCAFDEICLAHGVTKIETIGAEYVCAVGVIPQDQEEALEHGHSAILGNLIKAAEEILALPPGACGDCEYPVSFKMGIHTGPVVAGVVGQKLPRFRLFGDTINTAARMMQKGVRGEVQFGEATRAYLPLGVQCSFRGQVAMKGKGMVPTYLLSKSTELRRVASTRTLSFGTSSGFSGAVLECVLAQSRRWWQLRRPPKSISRACDKARRCSPSSRHATGSTRAHTDSDSEHEGRCVPDAPAGYSSDSSDAQAQRQNGAAAAPPVAARSMVRRPTDRSGVADCSLDSVLDPPRLRLFVLFRGFHSNERNFQEWFHRDVFCHELLLRVNRHLAILVVGTLAEVAYLVTMEVLTESDGHAGTGLEFYTLCRVFALCCVCTIRAALFKEELARRLGLIFQWFVFGMSCAVAGAVYASYASLHPFGSKTCDRGNQTTWDGGCGLQRNIVLMDTLPMHILLTSIYPFRFVPILAGIPLTATLVIAMTLSGKANFVVSSLFLSLMYVMHAFMLGIQGWLTERGLRVRYQKATAVMQTKQRIKDVLETLMPPMVVQEIASKPGMACQNHQFQNATVAQSDLCGFTELASTRQPQEVVEIISELFGRFDELTDKFAIYKVETVGDAYIAAMAEPPLSAINSPSAVVRFGLAMVEVTHAWSERRGENVSLRVGVHTGPCIGGIVGTKMQRYHLFGELLQALEILESTAPRGQVQVSSSCQAVVEAELTAAIASVGSPGYSVATRSGKASVLSSHSARLAPAPQLQLKLGRRAVASLVTSKGEAHSHAEVGGVTYIASACE